MEQDNNETMITDLSRCKGKANAKSNARLDAGGNNSWQWQMRAHYARMSLVKSPLGFFFVLLCLFTIDIDFAIKIRGGRRRINLQMTTISIKRWEARIGNTYKSDGGGVDQDLLATRQTQLRR